MASLHVENIPDPLLTKLRETALRFGHSLDEEVVEVLKLGIQVARRDRAWVDERLAAAKALRDSAPGAWITDEQIRAARDEGRP
jgi:plasmid stability protein